MTHLVELLYPRSAPDGIEVCVQDEAGFRIHKMSHGKAFNLAMRILGLLRWPIVPTQPVDRRPGLGDHGIEAGLPNRDTVVYESSVGWLSQNQPARSGDEA